MTLEIRMTEGPNVHGLPEDRTPFYVGHFERKVNEMQWVVLEGKKTGMPNTYHLHFGWSPMEEVKIASFEWNEYFTFVTYESEGRVKKFMFSNKKPEGEIRDTSDNTLNAKVETIYNYFGIRSASGMPPQTICEYFDADDKSVCS
ncbi:MAG: hypothetical protein Q7R96_03905 [Nanoarchaeota archaeon]|nr:hypothetical protein [Nanoarchaeota archaeon]